MKDASETPGANALLEELRECGTNPLSYGQETHGELHLDAARVLAGLSGRLDEAERQRDEWKRRARCNPDESLRWLDEMEDRALAAERERDAAIQANREYPAGVKVMRRRAVAAETENIRLREALERHGGGACECGFYNIVNTALAPQDKEGKA